MPPQTASLLEDVLVKNKTYKTRFFDDPGQVWERILNKTIIPYQVEIQPGPMDKHGNALNELCWLSCPWCYGSAGQDWGERLSLERFREILRQVAEKPVKFVFGGWATDPLFYNNIEKLHEIPLLHHRQFGFHTKCLSISDQLVKQITNPYIFQGSYISISIDAGTNETYNRVHDVRRGNPPLFDKVFQNIVRIVKAREANGIDLDISLTYLICEKNNSLRDVRNLIRKAEQAGVDLIRFSFPQVPYGFHKGIASYVPRRSKVEQDIAQIRDLIQTFDTRGTRIVITDAEANPVMRRPRILPCFARFIFPTIGYDGYMGHCSETSAPNFRGIALADLRVRNFWETYYDYDSERLGAYLRQTAGKMAELHCHCDRKALTVNHKLGSSGAFDALF